MEQTFSRNVLFKQGPRFLWFFILAYSMALVMANVFDARLIQIFGLTLPPGALIFPFTFLISDLITEVYGYKHARRAIWAAFLFNLIFLAFGQLISHLPSPVFNLENNAAFNKLLTLNTAVLLASFCSYLISEPLNAYTLAKLKIKYSGEYMGLRFVASTVVACGMDSLIFIPIAFGRFLPVQTLLHLILNIFLVKVSIELLGLPLSIRLARWLKQKEQIDIYDVNTNFNPVGLEVEYNPSNNHFKPKASNQDIS